MYFGLLIIIIPLIIGYSIPYFSNLLSVKKINLLLHIIMYTILFFMGINLSFLPNIKHNLFFILLYASVTASCILTMNFLALGILEKKLPWKGPIFLKKKNNWTLIKNSLILCITILTGFIFGLTNWYWLSLTSQINKLLLFLLLWLVGIQLRNNNMSLKKILFNRRGVLIAIIVAISALIGGAIASLILKLPLTIGLALSSAYGWYSLSSILITNSFGVIIGSTAFFNDLIRELLAIILIPSLIHDKRNTALGICGATSIDFTLPILQNNGGVEILPAAIVHGFILSILSPILITIFTLMY